MSNEATIALKMVKEAEGFSAVPYYCPSNRLTQGYGRNLEAHPLNDEEKLELNDDGSVSEFIATKWALKELGECEEKLSKNIIYQKQTDVRKAVLLDMCFNIGYNGIMKFKKMWFALGNREYTQAANEMKDSKYYTDVKSRGVRNVRIMISVEIS